jgi:SP family general alpha glucoside:H+ symporter-like MFS transporter
MIVWLFIYDMSVGPLAYTIVGETSSTRLRNKTVALSRMSYNVFSVCFGVLMPYMLSESTRPVPLLDILEPPYPR